MRTVRPLLRHDSPTSKRVGNMSRIPELFGAPQMDVLPYCSVVWTVPPVMYTVPNASVRHVRVVVVLHILGIVPDLDWEL